MKIGLGGWRMFLAFLVVISHLYAGMLDGPAAYAVWGFFVLSGYLMTLVLTTKYGASLDGLKQYAFSRVMRIYPPFLVALALGIVTIVMLGRIGISPAGLNPQFRMPDGINEWMGNLAMFPFFQQNGLPVPVAAALFVEVWVYAMMPMFARSRSAAWLGLAIALAANMQAGFGMDSFVTRYCSFTTCLLPFALGSVACHYRACLARIASPYLSIMAWIVNGVMWLYNPYWPWTYGLYVSMILSAWVVISLAPVKTVATDRLAGDLSYPVYLLHTTVGAWLIPHYGFGRSWPFFVASFALTLVVSWLMVRLVDRPIQAVKFSRPKPIVCGTP